MVADRVALQQISGVGGADVYWVFLRRHVGYSRAMQTAMECLAKASEMEDRASQCAMLFTRRQYLDIAMSWRDLARRALIHEQRDEIIRRQLPGAPDLADR